MARPKKGNLSESTREAYSRNLRPVPLGNITTSRAPADPTPPQGDIYMESFFERPILSPPYACSDRHWELDDYGQPTNQILPKRRDSKLLTPVPKPQKRRRNANQPGC